jgi:hypothetical protein
MKPTTLWNLQPGECKCYSSAVSVCISGVLHVAKSLHCCSGNKLKFKKYCPSFSRKYTCFLPWKLINNPYFISCLCILDNWLLSLVTEIHQFRQFEGKSA